MDAATATHSPAPGLLERRLVFLLGKGGVGRSTLAAALGVLAARSGRRAIVVEVSARGDVPRLFGRTAEPGVETLLRPGLWTLTVEPGRALDEYLRDQLPGRALADLLGQSAAFGYVAAATPGLRELLTTGKIWELAQDRRRPEGAEPYDVVIVDAPATGHGLALLEAPRTFASAAQIGPVARQGAIIAETLEDPGQTAMAAVAIAERAAVDELLDLRTRLAGRLDAVLVNGVAPRRYTDADMLALRGANAAPTLAAPLREAIAAALAEAGRTREQADQLERLPARLELPQLPAAELAEPELERLADVLEAVA
ncbi:MAG: ArsA-related P-loop ATPase [Solirubrobacteraceae bacterium]